MFKRLREPVSGLMHLGTAIAAVLGLAALLWLGQGSLAKEISLLIYGLSLVLMFSASSAYHLIQSNARVVQWLRKLDHSAIYVLIAARIRPSACTFSTGSGGGACWALSGAWR